MFVRRVSAQRMGQRQASHRKCAVVISCNNRRVKFKPKPESTGAMSATFDTGGEGRTCGWGAVAGVGSRVAEDHAVS